ncbi:DUF2887 domain-containing protein [Gloeobacter morelensis MG652769]|uniref:DUF2887 domain-containing protein n=1 Tax=Gloeobacter morelensis MG652769 TaxID=2781736 RepID=A0ABY3PTT3_9CYAN|nr:DUF2887 domain-containing protein [Gloeobacter morelensis MG652769]
MEVKETALRIDGVFVPTLPGQPHYFAEVQFQKDSPGAVAAGRDKKASVGVHRAYHCLQVAVRSAGGPSDVHDGRAGANPLCAGPDGRGQARGQARNAAAAVA